MAEISGPVRPRDSTTIVRKVAADRLPPDHSSSPTGNTGSSTEGITVCMTAMNFWFSAIQST